MPPPIPARLRLWIPHLRVVGWVAALLACGPRPATEAQESRAQPSETGESRTPSAEASAHRLQERSATLADYALSAGYASQWRLPGRLREISGLALTADGRIFAHDDERGVIYEIDYREGRLVKAFALGDMTAADDFEGIAVAGDRFYLVSSNGRLYESGEGEDGERVLFNTYGTGVGRRCEVEGLAFEPTSRVLLLACKRPRDRELGESVDIYRWSIDERAMASDSLIRISRAALTEDLPGSRFSPSGIERHPETGHYFILAAREEAIAVVDARGEVLAVEALPEGAHRQPEGITFAPDGSLFIADEGGGGRARLTRYTRPPHPEPEDRPPGEGA